MRLLAALVLASNLRASSGAAFLKVPQGARSTAMGGAMVASRGGAEGIWYSPAALFGKAEFEASLSRMAWIGETKNDFLSFVYTPGRHAVGIYANLLSTEDVYRDDLGRDGGKFSDGASVMGGAYALQMGPVTLGLGGKYYSENTEALVVSGFAFDLGGQIRLARGHLRLGGAFQNAYNSGNANSTLVDGLVYTGNTSPVPSTLRAGVTWLGFGLSLNMAGRYRPSYDERSVSAGLEYAAMSGALGWALRAGYDSAGYQVGDLAGLSIGGGIVMDSLVADIAWLPEGPLGNPYRLSVGWRFGSSGPEFSPPKPRPSRRRRVVERRMDDEEADVLLDRGRVAESGGQADDALTFYSRLTREAPDDHRGWEALGRLYKKMGKKELALESLNKALELHPNPEFKAWLDDYRSEP